MKYYVDNRNSELKSILVYSMIFVLITFFETQGLISPLQNITTRMFAPFSSVTAGTVFKGQEFIERVKILWQASQKVQELEKENALLLAELSQLDQIQKENEALKQLESSSINQDKPNRKLATIVNYISPTINIGERDGVRAGQLVLAQNTLIGIITTVEEYQSSLTLLTSEQIQPILVKTESGIQGILIGNNRTLLLTDVPRDVELKRDERVSTVGQEKVSANISIGTVGELQGSITAPVQTAVISQPISFLDVVIVEVF